MCTGRSVPQRLLAHRVGSWKSSWRLKVFTLDGGVLRGALARNRAVTMFTRETVDGSPVVVMSSIV
jgi:hypothetical protein